MDLQGEYDFNATFNIYDLSLFDIGDDLRLNPFKEREWSELTRITKGSIW